jgi:hypothetical protein
MYNKTPLSNKINRIRLLRSLGYPSLNASVGAFRRFGKNSANLAVLSERLGCLCTGK